MINTYTDLPDGWVTDYGRVFCPEHRNEPNLFAKQVRQRTAKQDVALAAAREGMQKATKAFEKENPRPLHPWLKQ